MRTKCAWAGLHTSGMIGLAMQDKSEFLQRIFENHIFTAQLQLQHQQQKTKTVVGLFHENVIDRRWQITDFNINCTRNNVYKEAEDVNEL